MFRIGAHSAILMLLAGLFLLRESTRPPLADIDEAFADFLSRNSRRHEERAPITFVQINDETLKEHPWPWSPLGQNYPSEQELEERIPASDVRTFTGPKGSLLFGKT